MNREDALRSQSSGQIEKVGQDSPFAFACHAGVPCFTECCRLLDLALSPYDVLRLRRATGLTSQQIFDQYLIEELEEKSIFPIYYLTMVDDGRASCVFVTQNGCSIYQDRPGACRTYPLGRAVTFQCAQKKSEHYILLRENHCLGFNQPEKTNVAVFCKEQGVDEYNRFNDAMASLLQHPKARTGVVLDESQFRLFTLALYNIDTFRNRLEHGDFPNIQIPENVLADDEQLLLFMISYLESFLFS